jgi:excisionase family DNA binding protein
MMEPVTELLSTREAAARLGLSAARTAQLFEQGYIEAHRTTYGWLASPSSVKAYIEWRATMPPRGGSWKGQRPPQRSA